MNRSPSGSSIYRNHTTPRDSPQQSFSFNNNGNSAADSEFVIHKSKGITTLFNIQDPLVPAKLRQAKEKSNNDSKADERGKNAKPSNIYFLFSFYDFSQTFVTVHQIESSGDVPAGRPSNWEDQRRPSFAGRFASQAKNFSLYLLTLLNWL